MEQNKFRCHFTVILENLGGVFWFAILMLISEMESTIELVGLLLEGKATLLEVLAGIGVVLAIIAVVLIYNWIVWAKTWISVQDEAIVIERNLLNRKVNTIGIKNISNINMEQNIFERIVGTYKIKLDTNSATTANETDVKIILSKNMAEQFKQQVMLRMNEEYEEVLDEKVEYDVEYKVKDIVMHCIYTANPVSVIFIIAFLVACMIALNSVNTGAAVVDGIINVLGSIIAIIFVVGSVVQSLIRDFFVYYNFKARRKENKIYLSHGFFKKRQYTIAVDKINAVEMVSPVFSRILGRQYVKVVCIGVGDEENENAMILLSEKKDIMKEKLSLLLPEFVIAEPDIINREKKSVWSTIPGAICMLGISIAAVVFICVLNVVEIEKMWIRILIATILVLILVLYVVSQILNFKTCGIGLGEDVLLLIQGSYSKTSTWIPYSKIQELEYSQGPILRRLGLAKGIVYILASVFDSINPTSYFKIEVFEEIHRRMLLRKGKR